MKPKDKATELIEKFGSNSIKQVDYTIDVWQIKLQYEKKKNHKRGIDICLRTLKYWNKVKLELINGIVPAQQGLGNYLVLDEDNSSATNPVFNN